MPQYHDKQHLTDEERRDFLKALGVGGAVAVGGLTLDDVRTALSDDAATNLAPIGQAVQADLASQLNADLLADQRAAFADAASALPAVIERGLPEDEPRAEFEAVAEAGRPVYDHLAEVGFFESTTQRLPEFTPEYIEGSIKQFVNTAGLASPFEELGFSVEERVDLAALVVVHRQRIGDRHWIATDQIPREQFELGEFISAMTQSAAGGVLLWLEETDKHLWQKQVLITEEILADAVWESRAMAAGFQLMTAGAQVIAEESGELSDSDLAALLSSGFALQAIAQNLLIEDVYWITDEMRTPLSAD